MKEVKTISGRTWNNATVHYYPDSKCPIKCQVNMKEGNKIRFQFIMVSPEAVESYFIRHDLAEMPRKYYVHKGA